MNVLCRKTCLFIIVSLTCLVDPADGLDFGKPFRKDFIGHLNGVAVSGQVVSDTGKNIKIEGVVAVTPNAGVKVSPNPVLLESTDPSGKAIADAVASVPANVPIYVGIQRGGRSSPTVVSSPPLEGLWEQKAQNVLANDLTEETSEKLSELFKQMETAARNSNASDFERANDEIVKIYAGLTNKAQTNIAEVQARGRELKKAYYGMDDNYMPFVYERMFKSSRSCAAIRIKDGGKPEKWASGALVAPDLVLTCSHEVTESDIRNLQVVFDYEQIDGLVQLNPVKLKVQKIFSPPTDFRKDLSKLDFALLTIDSEQIKDRKPLQLYVDPVGWDVPVFSVGHPRGKPRTILDNAWVLLPYQVVKKDFDKFDNYVLQQLVDRTVLRQEVKKDITRRYQPHPGGNEVHEYIREVEGNERYPCMGIDCDAFEGNSGGPIILKESGAICGILIAGEPDNVDLRQNEGNTPMPRRVAGTYVANWEKHERVLPFAAINEYMIGLEGRDWIKNRKMSVYDPIEH